MASEFYLPGRVVAKTEAEAITEIARQITERSFTALEPIRPYPCKVQHRPNDTWWEHYTKVECGGD